MASAIKRPFDTAFKQQRLKAWQPLMTPKTIILTFLTTGVVFVIIGIVIISVDKSIVEFEVSYPDCKIGDICNVEYTTEDDMVPPIYFYYKISGMYQNHRRYVKSRNDDQLRGKLTTSFKSCDPLEKNKDQIIYPCGLIAASVFNDKITASVDGVTLEGDAWNKSNIIWPSDRDKFRTNSYYKGSGFTDMSILDGRQVKLPSVEDEDLIVWMRTAGLPTFKKLYRIKQDKASIKKGSKLKFTIENNYDVSKFEGVKSLVVSTTSFMGGKNPFLGWSYIAVAVLCLLFTAILSAKLFLSPRSIIVPLNS
uniref:ALA-interacting subunit n=1 Tax=Spongospora subterranea TaxID=70186 RepID=A0A0H5R096_9EUKA|eukprot:CRZ01214.1 hypothetical protein [Spongospora subterranea]